MKCASVRVGSVTVAYRFTSNFSYSSALIRHCTAFGNVLINKVVPQISTAKRWCITISFPRQISCNIEAFTLRIYARFLSSWD